MAEKNDREDDKNPEEENESGAPKSKKKLIIFISLVLVLLIMAIGGSLVAVSLLSSDEDEVVLDENGNPIEPELNLDEDLKVENPEEDNKSKAPAIYYPLSPPLIVNYQARGRQRFLQAEITVMSREDDVIEAVELHMPMIRNSLNLVFSRHIYEELQTDEGRELLRQDALAELQKIMEQELGKPGIEKILFTNLVMQ